MTRIPWQSGALNVREPEPWPWWPAFLAWGAQWFFSQIAGQILSLKTNGANNKHTGTTIPWKHYRNAMSLQKITKLAQNIQCKHWLLLGDGMPLWDAKEPRRPVCHIHWADPILKPWICKLDLTAAENQIAERKQTHTVHAGKVAQNTELVCTMFPTLSCS